MLGIYMQSKQEQQEDAHAYLHIKGSLSERHSSALSTSFLFFSLFLFLCRQSRCCRQGSVRSDVWVDCESGQLSAGPTRKTSAQRFYRDRWECTGSRISLSFPIPLLSLVMVRAYPVRSHFSSKHAQLLFQKINDSLLRNLSLKTTTTTTTEFETQAKHRL